MGRRKNYKLKAQSDESDEPAHTGREKSQKSTMIESSQKNQLRVILKNFRETFFNET